MELLISVSAEHTNSLKNVIRKIVKTILLPEGSPDTYGAGSNSCYAKVAKYLRNEQDNNWQIMFFGASADTVEHACLYGPDGAPIADTFFKSGGRPVMQKGKLVYKTDNHTYPVLLSMPFKKFHEEYIDKQG